MRYLPRAFLAGGIGFAVSCLAACGGGAGLLTANQSAALQGKLNQLNAAVSRHDCQAVTSLGNELSLKVQSLPDTVKVTLKQDLINGVATAASLAARDCHQTTTTSSTSSTSSTVTSTPTTTATTTSTPTTTSSTTTSTTSSTTTTTTPTTPTTTTTTPSGGGGLGGGGGGGALGGGGGAGQASDPGPGPGSTANPGGHHA
jgi:hypothetical protein